MLNPAHPLYSLQKKIDHYEVAPRDPVSLGGLVATAIGGFAATATGTFLITTAIYLAESAVVSWAVKALTPKPDMGAMKGLQVNAKDAAAPGDIVYGTVRKGGTITFMHCSSDNKYLYYVIVLACHEVEEIGNIYIDNKVVTLDGTGHVTSAPWNSYVRIEKKLGNTPQAPWGVFTTDTPVTSAFRGDGIAYLAVMLEYNPDVFTSGIPLITAVVKGKKVEDPRTSTTAYSANAALCIRDYLKTARYGVGAPTSEIDDATFIEAANVCDESVSLAAGGTQKRYEINGVVSTADSPRNNLENMLTACAGSLYWGQGEWRLKVGKWYAHVDSFTVDDLRSEIQITTKVSAKDNFNVVKGTYVSMDADYIVKDFPEHRSSTFITQDGGFENVLDLELPYTTTHQTAQRLAKLALYRTREQALVKAAFSLKALQLSPGDNIGLTIPKYGWSSKSFEVIDWQLRVGNGMEAVVELTLKETSSASFNWTTEERAIIQNDSTLPDVYSGTTVTGLTATTNSELDEDGSWKTGIELTWTVAATAFVAYYDVQYKRTTATKWSKTSSEDNNITFYGLNANKSYDYRVRAVTIGGFRGAWSTLTSTSGKKSAAPAVPTSVVAQGGTQKIILTWINPSDKDLAYTEIYYSTTNVLGGAVRAVRTKSERWVDNYEGITSNQTYYYWVRSVDTQGNVSAWVGPISGTATRIDKDDLKDNAVTVRVNQRSGSPSTGAPISGASYTTMGTATIVRDGGDCIVAFSVELGEAASTNNPKLQCKIEKTISGVTSDVVTWKFDYRGLDRTVMTYVITDTSNEFGSCVYRVRATQRSGSTGNPEYYEVNGALSEIYK